MEELFIPEGLIIMRRLANRQPDWVKNWRIAFEMTLNEWKSYSEIHPEAKKEDHTIIDEKDVKPAKGETDVMAFMRKLKEKNPSIMKEDAAKHVKSFVARMKEKQDHPNNVRLNKDELTQSLSKGHYTIISAGRNPNMEGEKDKDPNDPFFAERSKKLQADLDALNVPYTGAVGHYGGEEHSFMVFHDDEYSEPDLSGQKDKEANFMVHYPKPQAKKMQETLDELGKKYNQDSVLHASEGKNTIRFTTGKNEGKDCGGSGWKETPEADDFFTSVETFDRENTKFSLDISDCFEKGMM